MGANYGATGHVSSNPFVQSGTPSIVEENVQPEARDAYLHGTPNDRSY